MLFAKHKEQFASHKEYYTPNVAVKTLNVLRFDVLKYILIIELNAILAGNVLISDIF